MSPQPTRATSSETQRPPSDIVDVADGVDRVMGDRALYLRMLARFRAEYRDAAGPISAALAAGDRILAHRRVHTLKGSSGMIGAHRLHQLACALEVAIRTNGGDEAACIAELGPEFAQVHRVIDNLLDAGLMAPARHAPMPKPLLQDTALLARLVELLLAGDGAAVDLLEESGASLTVILGETRLAQLAAAVNEFDYDSALRALRQSAEHDSAEHN